MDNIVYARCYTSDHLEGLLLEAASLMVNDEDRYPSDSGSVMFFLILALLQPARLCTPDRGFDYGRLSSGLLWQRCQLSVGMARACLACE